MKFFLIQCVAITQPHVEVGAAGIFLSLLVLSVVLSLYFTAVVYLKHRNRRWPVGRSLSFTCGMLVLGYALSPATVADAHHSFKGHMLQHLLIGMLAPVGLVMGAPVTLLLNSFPAKNARKITAVLRSRFFYILGNPLTAMVLNTGVMFILYLTPLYNATFTNPYLHHLLHFHFLAAGYLFTWSMIGPDPAPRRTGMTFRLTVLFAGIAAHSFLSKLMYAYLIPRNTPLTDDDIRSGAKLMYYGGDITELMILVLLFASWYRSKKPLEATPKPLLYKRQ